MTVLPSDSASLAPAAAPAIGHTGLASAQPPRLAGEGLPAAPGQPSAPAGAPDAGPKTAQDVQPSAPVPQQPTATESGARAIQLEPVQDQAGEKAGFGLGDAATFSDALPDSLASAPGLAGPAPSGGSALARSTNMVLHQVPLGAVPIAIGLKSLAGIDRFEIRLDPVDLGRIDVRLDLGEGGGVKAHLMVDRPETLALLQRDARALDRAFEQAGLTPSKDGIEFSLRDPASGGQQQRGSHPGRENAGHGASVPPHPNSAEPAVLSPARRVWRGSAGVDVRI